MCNCFDSAIPIQEKLPLEVLAQVSKHLCMAMVPAMLCVMGKKSMAIYKIL